MKESIKNKCELLVENKNVIEKNFIFSDRLMIISAALVFSMADRPVDMEKLKECKDILKKNAGVFSGLRSHGETVLVSKMALSDNPEKYLLDVKEAYAKIGKGKFADSGYVVQAATSICDVNRQEDLDSINTKFRELYKKMEKKHPFLTADEDLVSAVLLAMTEKSVDQIIDDMEVCFDYLKKEMKIPFGANEVQGLCEILALTDGDMKEKCDKTIKFYQTFKEHGKRYGVENSELAVMGTLIDIDEDPDAIVDEIIETAEYLGTHKGFGAFSLDKKQRLMFATILVSEAYSNDSLNGNAAINSSIAAVIAEEMAVMMYSIMCYNISTIST